MFIMPEVKSCIIIRRIIKGSSSNRCCHLITRLCVDFVNHRKIKLLEYWPSSAEVRRGERLAFGVEIWASLYNQKVLVYAHMFYIKN